MNLNPSTSTYSDEVLRYLICINLTLRLLHVEHDVWVNEQCLTSLDEKKDTMICTALDAPYAMSINNKYQND